MKIIIQLILAVVIVVLGYFLVESIMEPIRFNRVRDSRYEEAIEKLKDIRKAQIAYKSKHGEYSKNFRKLIEFVKKDSFEVIRKEGEYDMDDMTEEQAIKEGLLKTQKIKIGVFDSLFRKGYPIDSLAYVPFTNDTFKMGASEIETGSKVKVKVFEASVTNDKLLFDLDRQLVVNFNEEREKIAGFPGLKVGSLTEATNNAGNWE